MADDLQSVYERARAQSGESTWSGLSAHEQTVTVYQELRNLDAGYAEVREQMGLSRRDAFVAPGTTNSISVQSPPHCGQMEAWTVSNESDLADGSQNTRRIARGHRIVGTTSAARARTRGATLEPAAR